VTLGSIVLVAAARRWVPRVPSALLVVVAAASAAWIFQFDASAGLPLVSDRAAVPAGWPPGALPDFSPDVVAALLLPAGAIVLLGTLELTVTVKAAEPRPQIPREIAAQGLANVAGAFASAFPASASLTRSVLLRLGHPQTRAAAGFGALLTLPLLLFGGRGIAFIPQSSLAGILLITAAAMVTQPALGRMWRASTASRLMLAVTLVSTLVLPLVWAVFVGAGLGLIIHLARTSTPRVRALVFKGDRLVPLDDASEAIVVLEVSGALHYAAVEPFLEEAERQLLPGAQLVIVDLTHAHELRFTGIRALEWWAGELDRRGVRLRLAGVTPELRDVLRGAGSHLEYTMWDAEPGRSVLNARDYSEAR
jgi:SulP family sulfate permease